MNIKTSYTILNYAEEYWDKGFSVIPIRKGDKKPIGNWKVYQNKLVDKDKLSEWFSDGNNNIGIVLGNVSKNLFVIDFDGSEWEEAFNEFRRTFPELSDTTEVETGSGKRHLWLICPDLPSDITRIERTFSSDSAVELRANNHYVVVPPSIHPSGGQYSFKRNGIIKEITKEYLDRIIDFFNDGKSKDKPNIKNNDDQNNSEIKILREGERNKTLTSIAGALRCKGAAPQSIYTVLVSENNERCQPPLEQKELRSIAESILKYPSGNQLESLDDLGVSIESFLEEDTPKPDCYLNPWLYQGGTTMIYGQMGIGKTMLSLTIGLGLTHEIDSNIGSWEFMKKAGVVYIDGENSEYILKDRIKKLRVNFGKQQTPFNLISSARLYRNKKNVINIMNPEHRVMITEFFEEHQEYKILILDNLSALTPCRDENDKAGWDLINQWVIRLRSLDVSTIIIHHAGKEKKGGPRGTSGVGDALDSIIFLDNPNDYKQSEGARFKIKFDKNPRLLMDNSDISPFEITFEEKDGGITWKSSETKGSGKWDEILYMLMEGKCSKQKEIAEILGVEPQYISNVKREAKNKGLLDKNGNPTKKGKEWFEDKKNNN